MAVRRLDPNQPKEFAFTPENLRWAQTVIGRYPPGKQAAAVLPLLWRAQEQHDFWLPEPAIRYVADMLDMPYIRVYEIATFYTMFNLSPVGKYHVQLCGTTPCMLRGSEDLKRVCRTMIGEEGHVTADGTFSWVEVECLGACVNAPAVQINADYFEDLSPDSFTLLLAKLREGVPVKPGPQVNRQFSAPASGPKTLTGEAKPELEPRARGSDHAPKLLDEPEDGKADDLKIIAGIGPEIEKLLNSLGVYHFRQIAEWTAEDVAWVDGRLSFKGRIEREKWIEQARALVLKEKLGV
jgi:NADH-quinone oxidoreductase subunit E